MSLENEDSSSLDKAIAASGKMPRHSRNSYTREFLLSFSELEVCKKLPSGFDESILGEFADATSSIQDRQRAYGSTSLPGFRRTEHGSSPPTRGDMGTYSRGVYGRWDNRSSGRNDRDLDSQPDKDSDSGSRFGSQSRRSWQGSEHDGLLGSGSFTKPPGFSAPKNHSNDQNQLKKSNEPYHPPRPYKAAPLPRRDTTRDSFNDETFGSNEITSEDRAEEERRRRASFEFMRKEQHKAIQEKQKVNANKNTVDSIAETSELPNDCREVTNVSGDNDSDSTASERFSCIELGKSSLPSQTCRPLVPPGFTNIATEKDSGFKALAFSDSVEVGNGKNEAEESNVQTSVQNGNSVPKTPSSNGIDGDQLSIGNKLFLSFLTTGEQNANSSSRLDISMKTTAIEDHKHQAPPIVSEAHEVADNSGIVEINSGLSELSLDGEFDNKVLEQILGDTLSVNASSSTDMIQNHGDKVDDLRALKAPHSSKFARWFAEEETKASTNNISSTGPKDLLSLLVGGNKSKLNDSVDNNNKDVDQFNQEIPSLLGSEVFSVNSVMPILPSATITASSESVHKSIDQDVVVQKVLTCEDLEQTILSEFTGPRSEVGPVTTTDVMSEQRTKHPHADHASQHLLSLLKKGPTTTGDENSAPPAADNTTSLEKEPVFDVREEEGKNIQPPGKILTLETLFGTAFMKELQSVDAPVSIHRGVGSTDFPREGVGQQQVMENSVFSSATDHIRSGKISIHRQKMPVDNKIDKWLGYEYDDPLIDLNLSLQPKAVDFQPPEEEEGLVSSALNPSLNPRFTKLLPGDNSNQIKSLVFDAMKDASGRPFKHPDRINVSRDHLHGQTSTSNFQSMHMNNLGKSLHQQLDHRSAHINPHGGKFMGSESMIQRDVSTNQQFLRPSFHHLGMGASGVDRTPHHPGMGASGVDRTPHHPGMGASGVDRTPHHPGMGTSGVDRTPHHLGMGASGVDRTPHHPGMGASGVNPTRTQHQMLQQLQMLQQMQMRGDYNPHQVNDFHRGNSVIPQQAAGYIHEQSRLQGYPFGRGQPPDIGGQGIPVAAPDVNGGGRRHHPEAFQRLIEMELRANSKRNPPPFSPWQ